MERSYVHAKTLVGAKRKVRVKFPNLIIVKVTLSKDSRGNVVYWAGDRRYDVITRRRKR